MLSRNLYYDYISIKNKYKTLEDALRKLCLDRVEHSDFSFELSSASQPDDQADGGVEAVL